MSSGRVRRTAAEQLREEPELLWLLSGLLVPDEAGRAEVVAKARDDQIMRMLVRRASAGATAATTSGRFGRPN